MPRNPIARSFLVNLPAISVAAWITSSMATAATYHINPVIGNDSASGNSPTTAWKTFSKLESAKFAAGDSILLARDGIWRETFRLAASGSAASPIVVASYGPGTTPPEIRGSDSVNASPVAGERSAKASGMVKGVYLDRHPLSMARFPDTGWIVADALEGDTVVVAKSLSGSDWTGASIFMRSAEWTLEAHRIKRGTGGRLVLDERMVYALDSVRFYLANHPSASAADGNWYQSPTDSSVHWRDPPGGTAPTVEIATRAIGIDLHGSKFVTVRGLRVFATTKQGIVFDGTGMRIEDCELEYPGLFGIQMNGLRSQARGNKIVGAWAAAVTTTGAGQVVYGNIIRQTGRKDWLGPDGLGPGCCGGPGVVTTGDSSIVRRNDIDSSGLNAITFKGVASRIDSNWLAHSCMTTDDCGTIHTWAGRYPNTGSAFSVIRHNIVREAVGNSSGVKKYYPSYQGIYLDDGSHDIRVDSNVVIGNHAGIFLHNCQRDTVRGNLVYGNKWTQIYLQHDTLAGPVDMTGNVIQGNVLVSLPGQIASRTAISRPQTAPLATWSDNLECDDRIVDVGCSRDGTPLWRRSRLPASDPGLGPETQRNLGFDSGSIGWTIWPSTASLRTEASTGNPGHSLHLIVGVDSLARGAATNSATVFPVSTGDTWRLSFRAKGARHDQILSPVFRRSYGDYASFGKIPSIVLDTIWSSHLFLVSTNQTEAKARLDFGMTYADSQLWLDDISFRKVSPATLHGLGASQILASAPARSAERLPVGVWLDPSGAPVSGPTLSDYNGLAVFQIPADSSLSRASPRATASRWRLLRHGRDWVVEGLDGPLDILDGQGRRLLRIHPDHRGRARISPTSHGILWIRSSGRIEGLISLD